MTYRCPSCGQEHDDLPDLTADRPDIWWSVPESERSERFELTSDTCILDHEHYFFIRGVIEIPLLDDEGRWGIGVWVTQNRENFRTYLDYWDSDEIGPFFGWLATRIGCYPPDTRNLKTMAHFRSGGKRPAILVEPTDHPLAVDQQTGIALAKAWEMMHQFMPRLPD